MKLHFAAWLLATSILTATSMPWDRDVARKVLEEAEEEITNLSIGDDLPPSVPTCASADWALPTTLSFCNATSAPSINPDIVYRLFKGPYTSASSYSLLRSHHGMLWASRNSYNPRSMGTQIFICNFGEYDVAYSGAEYNIVNDMLNAKCGDKGGWIYFIAWKLWVGRDVTNEDAVSPSAGSGLDGYTRKTFLHQPKAEKESSATPQPPDRAKLTQLRHTLKTISDMLDEVDGRFIYLLDHHDKDLDEAESSGSPMSSVNPLVLSIDLHLTDMQRSSSALCKLVSKYRPGNRQEGGQPEPAMGGDVGGLQKLESLSSRDASPQVGVSSHQASATSLSDPVTPNQHTHYHLPTPELSLFPLSPDSLIADNDSSAYARDFSGDLLSSPPPLKVCRQRSSSPPITPIMSVPPLNLTTGSFPARSTTSLRLQMNHNHRRAVSSPFDYELGYLDGQIGDTSVLGRRHYLNLDQLPHRLRRAPMLRSVKSIESNWAFTNQSSPEFRSHTLAPGELYPSGSPVRGRLSSDSRCGLEPIGEVEADQMDTRAHSLELRRYNSRHFSTEEKTRRLRSRRRGSAPSGGLHVDSDEPLRIEELMEFLREGNSIRQL
ncbi:hypothetical protein VMCG_06037 [Cytospora schulzeri]|uniref:Ecp2 effector protein domain-containing protein n=1 Tax=Cytospora schulzeri TaxID=448051 RepID=A0A423WGE2_9PEZI|nr:hypothetical protein VMCG_06037 [Valsa malicola]